jgi:hypothetical protein
LQELECVKLENLELRCQLIAYQNADNGSVLAKSDGISKKAMRGERLDKIISSLTNLEKEVEEMKNQDTVDNAMLVRLEQQIESID